MAKRGKYGMGSVYKPEGAGSWYIRYYDAGGNRQRETGFASEREAQDRLKVLLGQVVTGTGPKVGEKHLTYGDIRELMLLSMQVKKLHSLSRLSNGDLTVKGLAKLDEYFGWTKENPTGGKVADFNPTKWESDFILARRQEGVSDATIITSAKLLRAMFKNAVEKKRLTFAPKVSMPKTPEPREHVLYKEQFDRLLDSKTGVAKMFIPLLTFLFYQGTRINEALNLKWYQVDLDAAIYHPNPKFNKTGDKEQKALHKVTIDALGEAGDDDAYVFAKVRSEGENPAKRFEKEFRDAMLRFGFGAPMWECAQCKGTKKGHAPKADSPAIECPECDDIPMQYKYVGPSPHSLRASCAVFYLESGMTETEVMKITGHSDIDVFRGYARLSDGNLQRSMNAAEVMRQKRMAEIERVAKANRKRLPVLVVA
jgi:integrase